jgi:hypothetical protein
MAKLEDIDVARKMINLQQSATSRNLEYNLTFETTKRLMSYTRCYYTMLSLTIPQISFQLIG